MSTTSALSAALNNASWCDAVCRGAGGTTEFAAGFWRNQVASPPYFPNVITTHAVVDPAAVEEALRSITTLGHQVGVKDSFHTLNLASIGFSKLFDASWICRDPGSPEHRPKRLTWKKIELAAKLRAWETAWWPEGPSPVPRPGIFAPSLLQHQNICFLGGYEGEVLVAGAAITETEDIVGLSCTFFRGPNVEQQRRELLAVLDERYPSRVVLGYESGEELIVMRELGFRQIGPLCVWLSPAPR
jgi:hypothetical protein